MKILILIAFSVIVSNPIFAQDIDCKVKIIKIDSTESNYFINGVLKKKRSVNVLIISKRDTTVICCERIKLKTTYLLKLSSYLGEDRLKSYPAKPKGTLRIREDGYIIWDGKSRLPYKSEDIKSLFYIRKDK